MSNKIIIRLDERIPDRYLAELKREISEVVFKATEKILLEEYTASDETSVALEVANPTKSKGKE